MTGILTSLIPDSSDGICGNLLSARRIISNLFLRILISNLFSVRKNSTWALLLRVSVLWKKLY